MKKILAIDKDRDFLAVLGEALLEQGFEVFSCCSAERALALMESHDFMAIIADCKMSPFLSSLKAARGRRRMPVILLTADVGVSWAGTSMNASGRVFAKPIDLPTLVKVVKGLESNLRREHALLRAALNMVAIARKTSNKEKKNEKGSIGRGPALFQESNGAYPLTGRL